MIFNKKGQAALLIAAVVSVLAIAGLFVSSSSTPSGAQVVGLPTADYTNVGLRSEAEQAGWEKGVELGQQRYMSNQGNRECITLCGDFCAASFDMYGKDVNDCAQFCKSGCEIQQRKLIKVGGHSTP